MTLLQRAESTVGPVAVDGRTITLVARTTVVHLGSDERGALHLRARPLHVEVLERDGKRHIVRIRDRERALIAAIAIGGGACAFALRITRTRSTRRTSP